MLVMCPKYPTSNGKIRSLRIPSLSLRSVPNYQKNMSYNEQQKLSFNYNAWVMYHYLGTCRNHKSPKTVLNTQIETIHIAHFKTLFFPTCAKHKYEKH